MTAATVEGPTFTDVFCGAGGSSIGLAAAGLTPKLAANHWDRAIATHSANFPDVDHLIADVSNYDMRKLPRTDVGWFSPECTWHSPAGGRKQMSRVRAQLDALEDYVPTDGGVRSRATAFDVIRAAEVHRYKVIIVENVVEFAAWEMFDWWLRGLEGLGYTCQLINVSSAHVGDDTNPHAPQWRDRLYIYCTAKGVPVPDVRPRPAAWCAPCGEVVHAVQAWKSRGRKGPARVGKYGQQYVYRCPNQSCGYTQVEPYVLPAAAAIDWSNIGTRIGDRDRPLAPATIRRIEAGLRLFGDPFVSKAYTPRGQDAQMVKSATGEPLGAITSSDHHQLVHPFVDVARSNNRPHAVDEPLAPVSTGRNHSLVTPPALSVTVNHDGDGRVYPLDERPLAGRTAKIGDGVLVPEPFVTTLRNHDRPYPASGEPVGAITGGGNIHAVTTPPGAFLQKHHGGLGYAAIGHMTKSVDEPAPAIVARPNLSLVIPYRRGARPYPSGTDALSTVATHDQHATATAAAPGIDVEDCYFRMLQPREHARAQRFPDSYAITGNRSEQTMQAGNAVSSNVAQWLGGITRRVLA